MATDDNNLVVFNPDKPVPASVIHRAEKEACYNDPMVLLRLGYLKIKNKDQKLIGLKMNEIQLQLQAHIRARRIAKRPVRIVILKGRQFGISTMSEAIVYSFASQRPNINALIMADDEGGAGYLFKMCKVYHAELLKDAPHLAPKTVVNNEEKIEFEGILSNIIIDTARNVDAGRKYTFHVAHLSEAARFKDFSQTMLSLMQSMPDRAETLCLIETTADGENDFCKFWRKVEKEFKADPDTCEWVPVFLSWRDHSEYSRPFKNVDETNRFVNSLKLNEDELAIMKEHKLTLEQMNWRRYTIMNKCGGDIDKFQQEYPLTSDEAFITSGKRVFKEHLTKPQKAFIIDPKYKGLIEMVSGTPAFIPDRNGDTKIWRMPQKGHQYVIGADSAEGNVGGDAASADVCDKMTGEQVATLHGSIDPEVFGTKLFDLGRFYNWALLAPESNFHGIVVLRYLVNKGYPNICKRLKVAVKEEDIGAEDDQAMEVSDLGWLTNSRTKQILISAVKEALRNNSITLRDENTLSEIKHFSVLKERESGIPIYGGSGGMNDDRVISLGITLYYLGSIIQEFGDDQRDSRYSPRDDEAHSSKKTGY